MSRIEGVCAGFMVGLVVGCMIGYMLFYSPDMMEYGLEGIAWIVVRVIPIGLILSILGAVIGYFAGGTSSKT